MAKFFRKHEKQTRWHIGQQPRDPEQHREKQRGSWTQVPSRGQVWLNGCSGWINYKWNKNEWRPW